MSTAHEIEEAIRSLSASERKKLLHDIPDLFPELGGDAGWEPIIASARVRLLPNCLTKWRQSFAATEMAFRN